MENTESPLSKTEYNYIRTIEKADELIAKQEEALKREKTLNEQMTNELATLHSSNKASSEELTALKSEYEELKKENEKLKADLLETTEECQLHVDNIEGQNDNVKAQNIDLKAQNSDLREELEELRGKMLDEEEMIFYHGCKADIILAQLYEEKEELTMRDLREKQFPMALLRTVNSEPSGIETSNFKLVKKAGENKFQLSAK